jgi:CheY-like chemotaxis protein
MIKLLNPESAARLPMSLGEGSDGLEAIQKAQTLIPHPVLLDIGLLQLNGLEVEKQLCQLLPAQEYFSYLRMMTSE